MQSDSSSTAYRDNVRALLRRWDPRGLFVTRAQADAAVARLAAPPELSTPRELDRARWVCDAAVHPVLKEPVPSAFRVCSFMPVTFGLSLAMISTARLYTSTLFFHWLYQSHSAATRYCNYADTSRPLSVERMRAAYAASTAAAWGIALGSVALVSRVPRLAPLGIIVPHGAVASAGAVSTTATAYKSTPPCSHARACISLSLSSQVSTIMNAESDLQEGVPVHDADGRVVGTSKVAARETVKSAVLLHGVLIPGCALLLPVVAMNAVIAPRLLKAKMARHIWPVSAALTGVCCAVVTPLVGALVPPVVSLPADSVPLEPGIRGEDGKALFSSRRLY